MASFTIFTAMSYINTFIKVSEDCPVQHSEVPVNKPDKKPAHLIQYELLMDNPYTYAHEDLVYEVFIRQKKIPVDVLEKEGVQIRKELFSKGHPCLRASALIKRYGFGAHYNEKGKIALYPVETEQYRQFVNDTSLVKLNGMKSKR